VTLQVTKTVTRTQENNWGLKQTYTQQITKLDLIAKQNNSLRKKVRETPTYLSEERSRYNWGGIQYGADSSGGGRGYERLSRNGESTLRLSFKILCNCTSAKDDFQNLLSATIEKKTFSSRDYKSFPRSSGITE
jgi:hypothetical protein